MKDKGKYKGIRVTEAFIWNIDVCSNYMRVLDSADPHPVSGYNIP